MGLGLLGIAQGAVKVGQKIFQGVKKRKEAKIEKRANALVEQKTKLANASAFFTPGIVQSDAQPWFGGMQTPAPKESGRLIGAFASLINPDGGSQAISGAGNALMNTKTDIQPVNGATAAANQNGGGGINPMFLILGGAAILLLFVLKKR